jgi:hypothetical protein
MISCSFLWFNSFSENENIEWLFQKVKSQNDEFYFYSYQIDTSSIFTRLKMSQNDTSSIFHLGGVKTKVLKQN